MSVISVPRAFNEEDLDTIYQANWVEAGYGKDVFGMPGTWPSRPVTRQPRRDRGIT